jgi:Putative auto-transporter adhesin, head GIN domain
MAAFPLWRIVERGEVSHLSRKTIPEHRTMIRTILPAFAFAAATVAAFAPSAALAGQTINVPPFRSIELHGGGEATLRHGGRQRVVLIKGDPSIAEIRVTGDGKLVLSPCRHWCWGNHDLEVEVTTPAVAAISVHGGGELKAQAGFPKQPNLALEVHGGGDANVRAIPADTVSVEVHGGGDAKVRAERTLAAEVYGGGEVRYWGYPSLSSSTHGGGSIQSGE